MKDSICIMYPSHVRLAGFPVLLFCLVCITFILIIDEADFVIRGLEAVAGGDIYVQSICVHFIGDAVHQKRMQMTKPVGKALFAMHPLYSNLGEYIITGTRIFTAIHIFFEHLFMAWVWFAALLLKTMDTHRWDKLFGTDKEYKAFLAQKKQKEIQKSD